MLLLSIKETYLLNSCNDIWETKCGSRQPGDTIEHYYKAGTLKLSRSCCSWITEAILRAYWEYEVPFPGKHSMFLIILFRNCETGNVMTSLVWSRKALTLVWLLSFPQWQSWQILMKPVQTCNTRCCKAVHRIETSLWAQPIHLHAAELLVTSWFHLAWLRKHNLSWWLI